MITEQEEFQRIFEFLDSYQSEYLDRGEPRFYRNRSQFEILGDGLVCLQNGPLVLSRFINICHSNPMQFKPLIEFLLDKGYVKPTKVLFSTKTYYALTEKGFQVAELYKRTKSLFVKIEQSSYTFK